MEKDPLGFIVSCSNKESKKPFHIKLYGIYSFKNDIVRYRLYKKIGSFDTWEECASASSSYARDYGWPYAYKVRHNAIAIRIITSWYFKDYKPIKMFESLHNV